MTFADLVYRNSFEQSITQHEQPSKRHLTATLFLNAYLFGSPQTCITRTDQVTFIPLPKSNELVKV